VELTLTDVKPRESTVSEIYERQIDTVYKICFSYLKSTADAEDAAAEVFLKLIEKTKIFSDFEHEKAFLIRCAINICKNIIKSPKRKNEDIADYPNISTEIKEDSGVEYAISQLPQKYQTVVYLHYYEGYKGEEISKILKKPHSTIRNWLSEARKMLKDIM
jgi:RNA polymerase sigma-70 factor (ECF subfamily)